MRLFAKYEGTGNDFIICDDPGCTFPEDVSTIRRLCHRRFGIGADGLVLVRSTDHADFEMVYFNADGRIGSMCGNGARCTFHFVNQDTLRPAMSFLAYDGEHYGKVMTNGWISVSMQDVMTHSEVGGDCVMDTGSPHYIRFVDDLGQVDVFTEGRAIRMTPPYRDQGINVNFVEQRNGTLYLATFERGVEDVTLSCGTGAVATALTHALRAGLSSGPVDIQTSGGALKVDFVREAGVFTNITLQGPVTRVFEGTIDV